MAVFFAAVDARQGCAAMVLSSGENCRFQRFWPFQVLLDLVSHSTSQDRGRGGIGRRAALRSL